MGRGMMTRCGLLAVAATMIGAVAQAEPIQINLVPDAGVYRVGDSVGVGIHATTSSRLVGFGFDLNTGPQLSLSSFNVGPGFVGVDWTPDRDMLAGLSFSGGVDGVDLLLGTAHFATHSVGTSTITLSTTPGDKTEGFARSGSGFFPLQSSPLLVNILAAQTSVNPGGSGGGGGGGPVGGPVDDNQNPPVPEPTTLLLLVSGLAAFFQRRR